MKALLTFLALGLFFPLYAQLSPIELGRSSNAIESNINDHGIYTQQNMVFASDSLNMVGFVHRQDVTIWGGGSTENGKFRYDLSTDGGSSFSKDIGTIQQTYVNYGRTPQMLSYVPLGTTNPINTKLIWAGHTNRFPTPGLIGKVVGCANTTTSGSVTSTEQYLHDPLSTHISGGLSEGLAGEFWMAEHMYDGSDFMDSLMIHKGTYNSSTGDVDWGIHKVVYVPHFRSGGKAHASIPNLAFSPDGMTAWIAFAGDLQGGQDSIYHPILLKTTDAGATWSNPSALNLSNFPIIVDSINGSYEAGMDKDFDLTVDMNNNLHLFTHVYASTNYDRYPGPVAETLWHAMLDITTPNSGFFWEAKLVSPAFAYEGGFGTPDPGTGDLIEHRLQPQLSRTEDGKYVFYAWVDQDTAVVGGAEVSLLIADLRTVMHDVSTGLYTSPRKVSDNDIIWSGQVLFPTMAPTVIEKAGNFHLPLVFMEMITNDQLAPCKYLYLGNDLTYANPNANTAIASIENNQSKSRVFPNPSSGEFQLALGEECSDLQLQVFDLQGKVLYSELYHQTENIQIDLSALANGVYIVKLNRDYKNTEVLKWLKY